MKLHTFLLTTLLMLSVSNVAQARDSVGKFDIAPLLESTKAKDVLLDVPLYFGEQSYGEADKTYGEVMTNKKTSAFMKSDREACEWVMLSALIALQERAKSEGMDAVVNIESYYKKREFKSDTQFECGAGAIMAGVALKGTLVKLKK